MKKTLSILLFMLTLSSYMFAYGNSVRGELSDNLLRFHILANSNSEQDQQIKLAVRNYVSASMADSDLSPKSDMYIRKAETLANEYLCKNAVPYRAAAVRERVYIPKKSYKNITMPSGEYDAIRLILGKGEGENWWCVAYPALCFNESFEGELSPEARKKLSDSISDETLSVIKDEKAYRLFIVDMVGKIMSKF